MTDELDILIEPDGTVRYVYDDRIAKLFVGDPQLTVRASDVEPFPGGGWFADMRKSGGPVLFANGSAATVFGGATELGLTPFATRQSALDAERAWLRQWKGV